MKIKTDVSMDHMPRFSKVTFKLSGDTYQTSFTSLMSLEGLKDLLTDLIDICDQIHDAKIYLETGGKA